MSCVSLEVRLLCVAIRNGDAQSVHYLLKEAHVCVPEEPSNTNPAILAAYYGHTALVKQLLDSLPGRQQRTIDRLESTFFLQRSDFAVNGWLFTHSLHHFIFSPLASPNWYFPYCDKVSISIFLMMDMDLLPRSVPEEGPAQLDAGYVLWAGSPGHGPTAGPRLRCWRQRLRHPQRWVRSHYWAATVRCFTSRYGDAATISPSLWKDYGSCLFVERLSLFFNNCIGQYCCLIIAVAVLRMSVAFVFSR